MSLLGKILNEHFLNMASVGNRGIVVESATHGSHCDDEGRVVRALYDILVQLDDLFDSRDYNTLSEIALQFIMECLQLTGKCALASDLI